MQGVPCSNGVTPVSNTGTSPPGTVPAHIVAAYLYWETEATSPAPAAMNGSFDLTPNPQYTNFNILGKTTCRSDNPACWSAGGTTGNPNGSERAYRVAR